MHEQEYKALINQAINPAFNRHARRAAIAILRKVKKVFVSPQPKTEEVSP